MKKDFSGVNKLKKLLLFLVIICFSNVCVQAATDNVLQSIQIDSFKDTYNIVLKSDEKPETKRIINDENKMMLTLKGVRASKDFNTIYNATNIDSVTVEPAGSDSVNISIQAQNVSRANLIYDTLDTPLGVLRAQDNKALSSSKKSAKKHKKKIVLSSPVKDYRPIFNEDDEEEALSFTSLMSKDYADSFISSFKEDGVTNTITILLIGIIIFCAVKLFRRNSKQENPSGLTQSLRDREMNLMQDMMQGQQQQYQQPQMQQFRPEMSYGIRTYQNAVKAPYQQHGLRSPYTTSDIRFNNPNLQQKFQPIQQPETFVKPKMMPQQEIKTPVASVPLKASKTVQANIQRQRPVSNTSSMSSSSKSKMANVDTMNFLDQMAKIYEKNGRADLAQGLKSKMNRV